MTRTCCRPTAPPAERPRHQSCACRVPTSTRELRAGLAAGPQPPPHTPEDRGAGSTLCGVAVGVTHREQAPWGSGSPDTAAETRPAGAQAPPAPPPALSKVTGDSPPQTRGRPAGPTCIPSQQALAQRGTHSGPDTICPGESPPSSGALNLGLEPEDRGAWWALSGGPSGPLDARRRSVASVGWVDREARVRPADGRAGGAPSAQDPGSDPVTAHCPPATPGLTAPVAVAP